MKIRKFTAVILVTLFLAFPVEAYDVPMEPEILAYLTEQCELRGVPVALALAVIETESGYDAGAVSADGKCVGLMQLHEINYGWLGEHFGDAWDAEDPCDNIEAGLYILAGYLDKYEGVHKALMCYNMGQAGAKRAWKKGVYSTKYSRKIVARMEELEAVKWTTD